MARPLISVATGLCVACGAGVDAPGVDRTVRDSAGIRIVENDPWPSGDTCRLSPTPDLDLGRIEGPPEYQLFSVSDGATLSDGRVAVVNRVPAEVRLFYPDGRFDRTVGGEGGGPGEFHGVARVWVLAGDTLLIADQRPTRMSRFTPDGAFLGSFVLEPRFANPPSIARLDDGTFVVWQPCCSRDGGEWEWFERTLRVTWYGRDGTLIDTLAVLPFGRHARWDRGLSIAGPPRFEAVSAVAAAGNRIVVGRGEEREIEIYELPPMGITDAAGRAPLLETIGLSTLLRWTGPDRTVTAEDIEADREWDLGRPARVGMEDDRWYREASEVGASEERLSADRFPAHSSIRIATDGRIWVREYDRRPGGPQEWLIFAADGRFTCRAYLPFAEPWDVYELGPDYVLGLEKDELDIEHVKRYRLSHR